MQKLLEGESALDSSSFLLLHFIAATDFRTPAWRLDFRHDLECNSARNCRTKTLPLEKFLTSLLLSRNTLRSRTWQRELFSNSGFYMPRFQPLSPNTYEKRMKSLAHVAFSGSVMSSAERNDSERRKEDMLVLLRDERSSLCRDGTVVHEQNFSFICLSGKPGNLSNFTFLKIIIINLKKMWRPTPQTNEALYWTQLTFVLAFGDWVSWL